MSDTNAAATLSVAITTGDAAAQLENLRKQYEGLKQSFASGVGTSSLTGDAGKRIAELKAAIASLEQKNRDLLSQVQTLADGFKTYSASAKSAAVSIGGDLSGAASKVRVALNEMSDAYKDGVSSIIGEKKRLANLGIDFSSSVKGLELVKKSTTENTTALKNYIGTLEVAKAALQKLEAPETLKRKYGDTILSEIGRIDEYKAKLEQLKVVKTQVAEADAASTAATVVEMRKRDALEAKSNADRLKNANAAIRARQAAEKDYTSWWEAEIKKREAVAARNAQAAAAASSRITAALGASTSVKYDSLTNTYSRQSSSELKAVAENQQRIATATAAAATAQQKWNAMAGEGHALARGLSGSLGTLWLTYGQLAPLMAGAALGAGFKAAAQAGAELAYQLTFVKALGDESAASVAALSQRTLELAKNSLYGPTEIASGFRILAQAGLNATDALKTMPQVLDLATVGEMEMEQAATTLVGVMNAFGLSVEKASHVGDVFAKAAALSQTSVQAMTNAMKTASVVGEQYGASMEDTATAITLLAKVNITGTAAGTSLRNMLKELYTPTAGAATVMKNLGLDTKDASGNMRQFADIIYDLQGRLKDFNKADQTTILQKIFGERGAKEAISMLALTRDEWDQLNRSISESSGFMRKVGEELEGTVKGRWTQAINTLKSNLTSAFGEMEGTFGTIADKLKATFDDPAFVASLKTLVGGMSSLVATLVEAGPTLVKFAEAWVAVKVGMIAASAWTAAAAGIAGVTSALRAAQVATTAYGVGLGAAVGAANAAAASSSLLSTAVGTLPARFALLANPITATVAVLATLGTAFYLFRDRTAESMEQSAKHITNFSREAVQSLEEVLAKVDQSNVAVHAATVKANETVIGNNLKAMTSQLGVLKRQFGFADAKSATDYVAQVDRDYAGNTLAHDDARRDRKSDKYKAAKAYNDILQETIKLQGAYGEALQKTEELETKRWAAKIESGIIDQNRSKRDIGTVVGGAGGTGASDVVAQINKEYEGQIRAILDGAKAKETALRRAYQQNEISEVELIEKTAAAKASAHVEALESYNEQIAKAEKAGAKGSQLTDLKNKQAEEVRAIVQVWDDASADVAEVKRKFAETLLSWEAKAFAKDGVTAVDEANAQIAQMMAALTKQVTEFPEKETLRIANAIKAIYNAALVKDAKSEIQKNFNSISTGVTELGSEVSRLESEMSRDGGWVSRVMNTQEITTLITTTLPELRDQIEQVKQKIAENPEADADGGLTKQLAKLTKDYDKFANYVPDVWKDTVKEIDSTFSDAFRATLENGKSEWDSFTESLQSKFKTAVADAIYQMLARPLVMNAVVSVSGALGVTGASNAAGALAGTTSGGTMDYLNMGSNAYSAYNMVSGGGALSGVLSGMASAGSEAALGAAFVGPSATLAGGSVGVGANIGSMFGSAAGAVSSAIPIIGGVLAIGSILSGLFGGSGERFERTATSQTATYNNGEYENTGEADYYKDGPDFGSSIDKALVRLNKQFSTSVGTLLESLGEEANITTDARVRLRRTSGKLATDFYATINGVDIVQQQQYGKDGEDIGGSVTQFVTDVMSKGIVKAVEASSLDAAIKSLFSDLDGVEQVSGMVSSVSALGKYSSDLNDVWGLSVAQAAKVATATSDTTDALITTIAAMATFAASQRSVGEQLSDTYQDLVESFAEVLPSKFPDTLAAYDEAMKGVNKTTEEGLKTFTDLFALREQYAAFRAAVEALQFGVAESTFALRDTQAQYAIQQQKLVDAANAAGIAVPRSAEELLALADKIDYTTESGLNLAAAMPALASAFAAAQTAAQATITGLQSTASDAYNIALKYAQDAVGVAEDALDAARNAAERAIEAAYESASSALEAQIDNLESISDTIKSALESNGVDNSLAGYRLAQQGLDLALAQMQAGGTVDADSLAQMVSRAINPDAGWFASQEDMLRAQARTNATLTELGGVTDTQKSAAETALASLTQQYTAQINALNGIDGTVKTVEQALADYTAAQKALNLAQFNLQQVELGKAQLDALNGVNKGFDSLAEAMRALNDSIYALALATAQAVTKPVGNYTGTNGAGYSAANDTWNSSAGAATTQTLKDMLTYSVNTQGVSKTYQGATGAGLSVQDIDRIGGLTAGTTASAAASDIKADLMAASAGGAEAIYRKAKQLGLTLSQVDALAGWSAGTATAWAKANGLPTFAAGGYHAGGLRLVGENGPELEVTGPSRILNADLTRRMLDGGSNEALVAEVRALREEVASLRATNEATARNTYSTKQSLDRVVDGDALLTRVAA